MPMVWRSSRQTTINAVLLSAIAQIGAVARVTGNRQNAITPRMDGTTKSMTTAAVAATAMKPARFATK